MTPIKLPLLLGFFLRFVFGFFDFIGVNLVLLHDAGLVLHVAIGVVDAVPPA